MKTTTDFFDFAERHGLALFPIPYGFKEDPGWKPPYEPASIVQRWSQGWSKDRAQWLAWYDAHRCNFGIYAAASGCIALDLDVAKDPNIWTKYCEFWTARGIVAPTPSFKSARNGWHVLVKVPAGFDLSTLTQRALIPNVDTRITGYIVAPGAFYDGTPDGRESGWYQMVSDTPAPHDNTAVFQVLVEVLGNNAADVAEPESYDLTDISDRCRFLIPTGYFDDEDTWHKSVWAIRRAFGASGWPIAQTISYADNKNRLAGVWKRENPNKAGGLNCSTLIKFSNENGYREHKRAHMFDNVPLPPPMPSPPLAPSNEQSEALPLIFFGQVRNRPRLRYHLRGFLAEGATSTIYGLPKTNKTTAAVDVCVHLAAGKDWRGKRIREARGVVYFAFERARQVEKGLEAYQVRDGFKDLPFAVCGRLIDMLDPGCVDIIKATIEAAERQFGIPVGLVVFDTWNKGIAVGGGNEDKAEHQNAAAANLRRLIEVFPTLHCMTIGHTGKDVTKGERGSNATQGDRDVGVLIEASGNVRKMTVAYANELADGDLTAFECETIEIGKDDDGEPVTGFIVSARAVAAPLAAKAGKPLNNSEANGFRALDAALRKYGKLRPEMDGRTITLDEWREHCFETGALASDASNPRKDFQRIREGLLSKARILIQGDLVRLIGSTGQGTPSNVIPMVAGIGLPPIPNRV
ncbi:AAA family ATPase [Bradyrhizobium sp. UFLA05-153]